MKKLLVPALLAALLAACSSTPTNDTEADVVKPLNPPLTSKPVELGGPTGTLPTELTDKASILSSRSIYFDYDKFEVKDQYKALVGAHGKYLNGHRDFKVLVQGNTDERGSVEYNLALGQKRAEAVKRTLVLLGAREDQVEAVSLGEEKPKAVGHNEAAWAENRRADILYRGPKGGEF